MSNSPGLVDSVINLPDGQEKFFEEFKLQKNREINLLIKTFLGLVEMMFGVVDVSLRVSSFSRVWHDIIKCNFILSCENC